MTQVVFDLARDSKGRGLEARFVSQVQETSTLAFLFLGLLTLAALVSLLEDLDMLLNCVPIQAVAYVSKLIMRMMAAYHALRSRLSTQFLVLGYVFSLLFPFGSPMRY